MDYLLLGAQPAHVYTDHRNLMFVFAPLALEPTLGRHIVSKVQRWALFLLRFPFVIEHVSGKSNVFADILTRWTRGYLRERKAMRTISSLLLQSEQLVPAAGSFKWPDMNLFLNSQSHFNDGTTGLTRDPADGLWKKYGKIWIPNQDLELQLKLIVVSHCGSVGHRGIDGTKSILKEDFYWKTLDHDVHELVKGCLHCIVSRAGEIVPRPLAHALHGEKPNDVIHIDFLYMRISTEGKKYVLIVRDDLSSYTWLFPTDSATSEAAAEALTTWIASFGSMNWLVSDQGSHFKNQLVRELIEEFHSRHPFTTAYSPWANGSVERVCREVLRACRALCSEWKLAPRDWPAVVESVQSIRNHAPLKRLGARSKDSPGVYRCPLEVFTGQAPRRPLLRALPIHKYKDAHLDNELLARQLVEVKKIQECGHQMHKEVHARADSSRTRHVELHNRRTNIQPPNFTVGDFVLVRRAAPTGHKLSFKWIGPRRVSSVKSEPVFEVEDLLKRKMEVVHARRLLLYRADMDGKEVNPQLVQAAEHTETSYQDARALRGIRRAEELIEICVEWEGLPDVVDLTWEPLKTAQEDLPRMLGEFLKSTGDRKLKQQALAQCSSK